MSQDRPSIPAELKRRVLVEAGHRCAIPTCRHIEVDIHHIIPWEQCQCHEYDNLMALCPNCHRRADRGEIDRRALRIYKANLRYTHDRFSQFEVDVLFELRRVLPGQFALFPPNMTLFVKRLLEAGYIAIHAHPAGKALSLGFQISPDVITITPKGREFLDSLGLEREIED